MKDEIKEIFELYEKQTDNPNLAFIIKTLKEWYFEKEDYKSRNKKAIEILKSTMYPDIAKQKALNILEGSDKE